jgi:hypothetical protein
VIVSLAMSKIIRREFMGNWWAFWLLCISVAGLPLAYLYFVNSTLSIEDDLEDPESFVSDFRSGKRSATK